MNESNILTTLRDGEKVTVRNNPTDQVPAPEPFEVFVRKLPFLDSGDLATVWGKPLKEILTYCPALKEADVKALDNESQMALYKKGRDLNFFTFKGYLAEMERTNDAFGQQAKEVAQKIAEKEVEKLLSPTKPA